MYYTYITYTHYGKVHQDLGLEDHVWQDKRAFVAKTVVLPCAQAATVAFLHPSRTMPPLLPARPWGRARWCFQTELIVLLFATNTNLT